MTMEEEELQDIYLNGLAEEGYKGKVVEDGEIEFEFEGKTYWIKPDEKDLEFFDLHKVRDISEFADKAKKLRAMNEVNSRHKLVKLFIYEDSDAFLLVSAGFYVKEPKDFITHLSRALGVMQSAINYFVAEMKKDESSGDESAFINK